MISGHGGILVLRLLSSIGKANIRWIAEPFETCKILFEANMLIVISFWLGERSIVEDDIQGVRNLGLRSVSARSYSMAEHSNPKVLTFSTFPLLRLCSCARSA